MIRRTTLALVLCSFLTLPVWAQYSTAEEVLRANIEATGGMDAWQAATGFYQTLEITMEMGDNMMMMQGQNWKLQSGYMLMQMTSEMMPGTMTTFISPQGGFAASAMGREEIPDTSEAVIDVQRHFKEEIALLEREDALAMSVEIGDLDGTPAYIVSIDDAASSKRFYDQESLLLLAVEVTPPQGEPVRRLIDDYRDVNGLQIPFFQTMDMVTQGMEMTQSIVTTTYELNPAVTPDELRAKAGGEGEGEGEGEN